VVKPGGTLSEESSSGIKLFLLEMGQIDETLTGSENLLSSLGAQSGVGLDDGLALAKNYLS